jgi:signal transduction histidine kinase
VRVWHQKTLGLALSDISPHPWFRGGNVVPLTELPATRSARRRTLMAVQTPFVAMAAIFSFAVLLVIPDIFVSPFFVGGVAIIVATTAAGLLVPWNLLPYNAMIVLALADLVAVSFMRVASFESIPGVGYLAVFPAIWIAYAFHGPLMSFAVWGSIVLVSVPLILVGATPETPLEWINVLILPTGLLLIVWAVRAAARQVRESRAVLRRTSELQVKALRAAQDSELVMRSIFDTVDAAMAFYDVDERPVMANDAARMTVAKLGFSLDHPPFGGEYVYKADRVTPIPIEEQIIPRALRGERIFGHVEWLGPPGDQSAIMASAQQVNRADGELLGTVIAVYDITELANAVSVREEFLRTVSHELRTPLTSIIGYLEVMEDSTDLEEAGIAGFMEIVQRNAAALHTRVAQLLAFSDITTSATPELADASDMVRAAVDEHRAEANKAGLTITADVPDSMIINADVSGAQQVLGHLISNAIKYTSPGGAVTVSTHRDGNFFVLRVTDTGRGMTPEEQRQAFDRFFRAPGVRTEAVQGFGIGLSIVKEIVEAHEGTVSIDSTPGIGTTVTVRAAIVSQRATAAAAAPSVIATGA